MTNKQDHKRNPVNYSLRISALIISLLIMLPVSGCSSSNEVHQATDKSSSQQICASTITTNTPLPEPTPTPEPVILKKATRVQAEGDEQIDKNHTYTINENGNVYILDESGKITLKKPTGEVIKGNIIPDYDIFIVSLYYIPYKGDIIILYQWDNGDGGAPIACRVNGETLSISWDLTIMAYSIRESILEGTSIFIAGSGFIGKLDAETGKLIWQRNSETDKSLNTVDFNDIQITDNTLKLKGETGTSPIDMKPISMDFDKNTGNYIKSNNKENTTSPISFPYVNFTFPLLGQSYDKVKEDVNNWVYGKGEIREVNKDDFNLTCNINTLLDFKFEDSDRFILVPGFSDIFVIRNNTIVANFSDRVNNDLTIYDMFKRFISTEPYTEKLGVISSLEDDEFRVKHNLSQQYSFQKGTIVNVYHYTTNNTHLRIVGLSNTDGTEGQAFYKDKLYFYLQTYHQN